MDLIIADIEYQLLGSDAEIERCWGFVQREQTYVEQSQKAFNPSP